MSVIYLPAAGATEIASCPPRPSNLGSRARGLWWRLRLALAGVRLALRGPGSPLILTDDEEPTFTLRGAEVREGGRRRAAPARVIDLDAARTRRRRPV